MNRKPFKANNWFVKESDGNNQTSAEFKNNGQQRIHTPIFPTFKNSETSNAIDSIESNDGINKFFTPGWTGESLISKDVKKFLKVLDNLHKDVAYSFTHQANLNRKLKAKIFDEFLSFAECKAINCTHLDDYNKFYKELKDENSKYREVLDQFLNIYTYRIAVIFLLKIRFISVILKKTNQKFNIKSLVYPNSFLTSVFQKGSSRELNTKALEQNIFSWYKPNENIHNDLIDIYEFSDNLSITEIIKNISMKSEQILSQETPYSHALSHKNFGLFLNSLLINFPLWLNTFNHRFNSPYRLSNDGLEVISCKFDGNYLESLSLSHWLAQENNQNIKWEQILCPDFKGGDFETGLYIKIINELQFLTFLAQIANKQGRNPIDFVSKVTRGHLHNRKNSNEVQKSLLINDINLNNSTYDRIILNIAHTPKNNVQHYLINQIQQNTKELKENGLIYLVSSKKLFVHSQKSKIDTLLKKYKLEGIFDLEQVKGKGEVGSYIYIFSKAKNTSLENFNSKKQPCFTFRLNGNLETFQYFNYLTLMVQNFFFANLTDVPPMYHKEMGGFELEFFQDAIVDGRLIHSTNKDSSKITHPMFFNGLMKSCYPLDFYFDIQNVDFNNRAESNDTLFGFSLDSYKTHAPYVLIVDSRAKDKTVNIEIINYQSLEAKAYEYGHSMCSYFEITPKWHNLNLNAIKDFFETAVGKQIIDLTFNNETRKIKANLSKLLIPKFFNVQTNIPEHIDAGLRLLKLDSNEILNQHPTQIDKEFKNIERLIYDLAKHYPAQISGYVASFRRQIDKCINQFGVSKTKSVINFSNPILKSPLVLSKTQPIYPHNNDLFIEFNSESGVQHVHSPLEKIATTTSEQDGYTNYALELYSQGRVVLTIYSDIEMIKFLEFIFSNVSGTPISKILQGVQVPALEDLKSIMQSFNSMKRTLLELSDKTPKIFERIITSSITHN